MKNYGKLTLALVILWFVFALSASADHLFKNNANRFGVGVALAALVPVLIFGVWFAASKRFREFTPLWMPAPYRLNRGGSSDSPLFCSKRADSCRRSSRCRPDTETCLSAPQRRSQPEAGESEASAQFHFLAGTGNHRPRGRRDSRHNREIVFPVSSMEPMTVLPLSLVPIFFVPLLLMLHVISIAQARGWKEGSSTAPSEQRVACFAGRGEQARAKA